MSDNSLILSIEERLATTKMPAGKRKTLLAAITLFAQHGFHGTSTAQLAQAAGVSQATVFKYFKTKEELLAAVIRPMTEIIGQDFISQLSAFKTKEELIHFIVRDRYAFVKANQNLVKILLQELLTNPKAKVILKEQVAKNIDLFMTAIAPLRQNPKLSETDFIRRLDAPLVTLVLQEIIFDLPIQDEEKALQQVEKDILRLIE
ncbi:TetR/AcrR family transcriptional regulator [Streptococcus dentiloxodontae]